MIFTTVRQLTRCLYDHLTEFSQIYEGYSRDPELTVRNSGKRNLDFLTEYKNLFSKFGMRDCPETEREGGIKIPLAVPVISTSLTLPFHAMVTLKIYIYTQNKLVLLFL